MSYPAASTWVAEVLSRLRTTGQNVRLVAKPNPDGLAVYRAEQGIAVAVGSPSPDERSGAGRWGLKVTRGLEVTITTECLQDQAGDDQNAVIAHLNLQEAVIDALLDRQPTNRASQVGITCNWTPGGQEQNRLARRGDSMLLDSTLYFTVTYAANLTASV